MASIRQVCLTGEKTSVACLPEGDLVYDDFTVEYMNLFI